jgi:hypothetical protein
MAVRQYCQRHSTEIDWTLSKFHERQFITCFAANVSIMVRATKAAAELHDRSITSKIVTTMAWHFAAELP